MQEEANTLALEFHLAKLMEFVLTDERERLVSIEELEWAKQGRKKTLSPLFNQFHS